MPLDTSVKFYHSGMTNVGGVSGSVMPWLANNAALYTQASAWATQFTILDKLLVSGFNSVTAASVVVASNVATVTFGAAHGFEDYTVVSVSGATPSGLNGEKRITTVSSTVLTYEAPGISDQTATGTISVKYAPLGWSYVGATPTGFPLTIRSTNVNGAMMGCAITANGGAIGPSYAHGWSYQGYRVATASAVSIAFGSRRAVPLATTGSGSYGNSQWIAWGDDRTFYMLINGGVNNAPNTNGYIQGFGDFQSIISNDSYTAFVHGESTYVGSGNEGCGNNGTIHSNIGYNQFSAAVTSLQLPALANGGVYSSAFCCAEYALGDGISGAISGGLSSAFPNSTDNALILARKAIGDGTGLRGYYRGIYVSPQNCGASFTALDKVTGTGALANKKLLVIKHGTIATLTAGTGVVFVDITGPWT